MEQSQAFAPGYGTGVLVTFSTTATTVQIDSQSPNLRIQNLDPAVDAFIRVTDGFRNPNSDAGVAAVVNADLLVRAGTTVIITKGSRHSNFSVISAAGAPTKGVYVQAGLGLWGN